MKKTFEENDAGFQYIIDKKGQAAYNIHNQLIFEKIKEAKNLTDCSKLLSEWLKFFRSGHVGIQLMAKTADNNGENEKGEYETFNGDISQFKKYIDTKTEADFEGIWETSPYKIGIKKEGTNYIGFIIESGVESWKPGMVKLKIKQDNDKLVSTFYMRDHSIDKSEDPKLIGNNYLQIGQWELKRLRPVFPPDSLDNYYEIIYAQDPYLKELNANTLYFRIPSFDGSEKTAIDSVILANKDKILKTENLIIDVRYNGGGNDDCYYELLPFLYTNQIRTIGLEYLSTKQNNQRMLDFAANANNEKDKQSFKEKYDKLQSRLGEFVNVYDEAVSIRRYDTVYEYPKNVGIIVSKECGSTTEQFLLDAKQSKKVKLFGVNTFGAIDFSNMYYVESPCKEFRLGYCLTRRLWIPDLAIDNIGLQPDFYLDESIPPYKWVEFVNKILNQ